MATLPDPTDLVDAGLDRLDAARDHLNPHRGQLMVYLRAVEVPLPQLYGPTADEPWGSPGAV